MFSLFSFLLFHNWWEEKWKLVTPMKVDFGCFYNPSRDVEEEADIFDLEAWEWRWEAELPLPRPELWRGLEMGGSTKPAASEPTCVTTSVSPLNTFALVFDVLALRLFTFFSALWASAFCLCRTAGRKSGGRGLKSEPETAGRGLRWGLEAAGWGLKWAICWDSIATFLLSMCASAVMVDKELEGFAEDIKVSVRRGIFLARLFLRCRLCCDCCFFASFLLSFWCFLEAVADCFARRLSFFLCPLVPFFFPPLLSWFLFSPSSCSVA